MTCCCSLAFSNFNIYEWTLWSLWLIAAFLVYPLPGQRCQSGTTSVICNLQKKIGPDCREGVRAQLERMKKFWKECNNLYEKQNDLKGQKYKIENCYGDKKCMA